MTETTAPVAGTPERAFLDANVIRGQLTNDILLSLADHDVFDPRWSQRVLDEMRRNRPDGVTDQRIDHRIAQMNKAFPTAMTTGFEALEPEMPADEKDKHVLAAAVHSGSSVLVTDNLKDFHPASDGPHAMRLNSLSGFLSRKLEEQPGRVLSGLRDMLARNRRDPHTMSQLIDKLASTKELRGFALKLDAVVPAEDRGTHDFLTTQQPHIGTGDGLRSPTGAVTTKPVLDPTRPRPTRSTSTPKDRGVDPRG